MKFKVSDIKNTPQGEKKNKKGTKTPLKIKVVDVDEKEAENEEKDNTKKKTWQELKQIKKVQKQIKRDQKGNVQNKSLKPNLNLLLTDDEEFKSLVNDGFSDDGSEPGDFEGDYANFMEEMAKIDGKKKKILSNRVEGTGDVSEFNLSGRKSSKIDTSDLVSALEDGAEDVRNLTKRLTKSEDEKLEVTLDDVAAARVVRGAGYTGVVRDISVWDAVVHSRRAADTVSFPLNKADLRLKNLSEDTEKFKPETSLEQQVAAMLAGASSVPKQGERFSEIEKKCLEGLTVQEALERKKELAKIRALQTYQEQKYRRLKKIKSKKFRKVERKMKKKEELAEIEQLAAADPEAAAEKLEQLDKSRIEERASLKHRTSKYLQDTAKRAKITKNKDFTNVVNDQLRKHRELTAKQREASDDIEMDENDDVDVRKNVNIEGQSVDEFNSEYRKFWEAEQERLKASRTDEDDLEDIFEEAEYTLKKKTQSKIDSIKNQQSKNNAPVPEETFDDSENPLNNVQADSLNYGKKENSETIKADSLKSTAEKTPLPNVNPDDFMNMKSDTVGSDLPEIVGYNELEDGEDDDDQRDIIAEAFADDNVVDEFKNEKKKLVDSRKPKDIDLTLPGWGEWGGGGAVPSKRKRKRFTIKAPPPEKRRDENTGHLILNTDKDDKIRKYQVSNIPFPYNAVSDFEASIRAPVGSTFLPRTAHLKMIKPRVTTKAGHIIEPIDKDQLVKRGLATIAAPILSK